MKVLFCQPSSKKSAVSGPERQTVQVGRALRQRGHEVEIGILLINREDPASDTTLGKLASQYGIPTASLSIRGRYHLFGALLAFRRFVAEHCPDVVCVAGYWADILSALTRCAPSVVITRGWTRQDAKVRIYEWIDRLLLRRHCVVVTVSPQQREEVLGLGVPAERVRYIPNGIDAESLPPPYTQATLRDIADGTSGRWWIGIVGRLSVEKGHRYALQSLARVRDKVEGVRLLIVGDGAERDNLQRLAEELGVSSLTCFTGERSDARQIIGALDLLVLPSLTEGIPNVVLEAFAYRTPVVATAVGGVPELVKHGETGWLVPPRDPSALAQAIVEALSNPEEARRRADNAYKHLMEHFTVEKQVDAWERALQAAVENWRRGKKR